MNIITRLKNTYHRIGLWIVDKLDERLWKERQATALKGLEEPLRTFVNLGLTNEINYLKMSVRSGVASFRNRAEANKHADFFVKVATRVLVKMHKLTEIVGVQPMQGPVGLVYRIVFQSMDGEGTPVFASAPGKAVRLSVVNEVVQAQTRKLQTRWTLEAAQDVKTQHGVDPEQEILEATADMIVEEVFREVIKDLITLAKAGGAASIVSNAQEFPEQAFENNSRLIVTINTLANQIGAKTRRGTGNFIVTTPLGVSLLQAIGGSNYVQIPGAKSYGLLERIGTLYGTIKVYMSSALPEASPLSDTFLIGYKGGNGETDTGYIYSPYVPVITSGPVIDPQTFQPMTILMTRYGKTTFEPTGDRLGSSADYYAYVVFGKEGETTEVANPEEPQ